METKRVLNGDSWHVVYENHPMAAHYDDLQGLALQGIPVRGYDVSEYDGNVPKHYTFRNEASGGSFVCGADLLENGMLWANGNFYDSVQKAIDVETARESAYLRIPVSIVICTEEAMNL